MSSTQIALLKKYGLAVRGLSGQHLLIDPNIQRKIVELVAPKPKEWIVEIGPGIGALTAEILAAGAGVIAIEKDKRFCEILEGELGGEYKGRLHIENADVLKTDLGKMLRKALSLRGVRRRRDPSPVIARRREAPTKQSDALRHPEGPEAPKDLDPSALRASGRLRCPRKDGARKIKIISNLPYYITSPILFWLIDNRPYVERAILMIQREVARRLTAQPGNKDYGRLTLALRYYSEVRREFDVSRNSFTPKPDVDSTVVTIDFHPPSKFPKGIDEAFLFHVIQVAFGARRKTLLNRLAGDSELGKSREELAEVLRQFGLSEKVRGEDLLLKDFIALAEALR